ncbi:immunoglobulin lambda-1 light chain-like [Ahaetulla prasina]|uniref:immunoglobulin lambda-1 light chain-like n=1 Tax=Ahaetulla prasina TaxID=499056 RepID=UPI002648C5C7|nr:immunoglobulin lambda-1 light chain-like [Ahaetulla prasina]
MAWSLLLAFFFLWCTGANSQYTLTQPATLSIPLGEPVKISCTMSQDSQMSSSFISWYQQKAGESPKFLLYDDNNNGRFSGTIDSSANVAYLNITNTQFEDEADYYCGGDYSSDDNWRYHSDTLTCRISQTARFCIMAWSLLLAFFFLWCTGANSQYTLTQPATLSFPLTQPVKLSCTMSRDSQVGSYTISWYQQKAGESPNYLLYNTGSNGRFTGSKDTSANAAYLTITNFQPDDEADYYCAGPYSSGGNWRWVFGGGTQLLVTGRPTVPPSVQVFAPTLQEIRSPNPYTVVCLLTDFYPPAFELQWKGDDQVIRSGVETTKASKQGDKYLASSYLRLTAAEYQNYDAFTCQVTHESKTIAKTVSKSGSC